MNIIRQMRVGQDYQAELGTRMRAIGEYAELIARLSALACKKIHLQQGRRMRLSTAHFLAPAAGPQVDLGLWQ